MSKREKKETPTIHREFTIIQLSHATNLRKSNHITRFQLMALISVHCDIQPIRADLWND